MRKLPYVTSDSHLALCLEMVGYKLVWWENRYTKESLAKLGCATVRMALARGQAGKVIYAFECGEGIDADVAAFHEARKKNEAGQPIAIKSKGLHTEDIIGIAASALRLL